MSPNQTVLSVIPPLALQEEMVVTDAFVAETGSSKQLRAGRIVRQRPRHDPVKPHLCKDQIRHFIQCLQRISSMLEGTGKLVPDLATGGNTSLDIVKTDRADNLPRVLLPVYIKSDASTLHCRIVFKRRNLLLLLYRIKILTTVRLVLIE